MVSKFLIISVLSATVLALPVAKRDQSSTEGAVIENASSQISSASNAVADLTFHLQNSDNSSIDKTFSITLNGYDQQLKEVTETVTEAVKLMDNGLSSAVGNYLLTDFVNSVSEGAKTIVDISNEMKGDDEEKSLKFDFSQGLSKFSDFAKDYGVDTTKLNESNEKLTQVWA